MSNDEIKPKIIKWQKILGQRENKIINISYCILDSEEGLTGHYGTFKIE